MPLDTGHIAEIDYVHDGDRSASSGATLTPTLSDGPNIGSALKAVREHQHLSLESVAEDTRIRRAYLAAIEEGRLEALPSRPFTIGYIRAYARALGLDGEAAVERFRTEEPAPDQALREPLGVQEGRDPRLMLGAVALALIVAAIVLWNVVQRLMIEPTAPATVTVAATAQAKTAPSTPQSAAVALGAPLPPPIESTTPPLYETPGLEAATAAGDGSADSAEAALKAKKAAAAAAPKVEAVPTESLPATFTAQGAVYGGPAETSPVVLQARKPASIIVRGADGTVYFARQLAAGESYRAPALAGLTVDVSEPEAFQVFVGGQTKGLLPAAQTPIGKFAQ